MSVKIQDVLKYGNIEFLAKKAVEGFITGLHKSPYHGFSVEFAEHKQYNPGESTRHIDWKVFARTDKLYTKEYEEETNLRCQLLVDVSSSMYYPAGNKGKLLFSALGAASIAYMLQKQRDAVGLTTFSDEVELVTPIKSSKSHLHGIYARLNQLIDEKRSGQKSTNVAKTIHQIAIKLHKRSLVVIFSDMFDQHNADEVFQSLQHLKHKKHEVLLFHVTDKATEMDFTFEDRPHIFTDVETGKKVKVSPEQVKSEYISQMNAFKKSLKLKCGQYKIDFIEADINKGVDQVLMPYLVKRQRIR